MNWFIRMESRQYNTYNIFLMNIEYFKFCLWPYNNLRRIGTCYTLPDLPWKTRRNWLISCFGFPGKWLSIAKPSSERRKVWNKVGRICLTVCSSSATLPMTFSLIWNRKPRILRNLKSFLSIFEFLYWIEFIRYL